MKKKSLLLCTAFAAIAAAVTVYSLQANNQSTLLFSDNVEALAQYEDWGDGYPRNEWGCIVWYTHCLGIQVTPSGNYPFDIPLSRN